MPTRYGPESCLELQAGTYPVEIEVQKSGEMHILCPCCGGSGEHDDLPGINPASMNYGCLTCHGQGDIDREMDLSWISQSHPRSPNPEWKGCAFTPELQVWQQDYGDQDPDHQKNAWKIEGTLGNAKGGREELLRMAHGLLENLEHPGNLTQTGWLRQYRRLTGANAHTALQAFRKACPEPGKAAQ